MFVVRSIALLSDISNAPSPKNAYCNRDHGSEDAVVFPRIGGDGYFDHRGFNRNSGYGEDDLLADTQRLLDEQDVARHQHQVKTPGK